MTLHFTLAENDVLACLERYLHDSKSYQKSRTRARWSLPCVLFLSACFIIWHNGVLIPPLILLVVLSVGWWLFYPRWIDATVRSRMKARMGESGYAKRLGSYELQLLEEHLHSKGPLGTSTLAWKSVDRVVLDTDYLHIFLAGGVGWPIRISEIGQQSAQAAHDFISSRIAK